MRLVKGNSGKWAFIADTPCMLAALYAWGGEDVAKAVFDYASRSLGLCSMFNSPAALQYSIGDLSNLAIGLSKTGTGLFVLTFHCNEPGDVLAELISRIVPSMASARTAFAYSASRLGIDILQADL